MPALSRRASGSRTAWNSRGWRERDDVLKVMAEEADVLLFPSLHDEAGLAVAEAAAIGLPIVCLDRGGPPIIAGWGVEPGGEAETVDRLRAALETALDSHPPLARLDPDTRRAELVGLPARSGAPAARIGRRGRSLERSLERPAAGPEAILHPDDQPCRSDDRGQAPSACRTSRNQSGSFRNARPTLPRAPRRPPPSGT